MIDRLVYYLISGTPHLPYVIASLRALRRYYMGPVRVYAYPESYPQVCEIGKDDRLCIVPCLWEPVYRGKNGQGLNRIVLAQSLVNDAKTVAYLDADTLPNGCLDGLFEEAERSGHAATQFCDWVTNRGTARNRVSWMLGRGSINQDAVKFAMQNPIPSVNCGVFACRPSSPTLPLWEQWNREVLDLFIADEVTQHAVAALHYLNGWSEITVVDGRWNSSPKYKQKSLPDDEVKIWHFHGDSNVRPNKTPKGVWLWWQEYDQCLAENLGGVRSIQTDCGNGYLSGMLKRRFDATTECFYCAKDLSHADHDNACPAAGI